MRRAERYGQAFFRSLASRWFRYRAPQAPQRSTWQARLNPSNHARRLVCRHCYPERELLTMNWYAVYCWRCNGDAIEEMTEDERDAVQAELDAAEALRNPLRTPRATMSRLR